MALSQKTSIGLAFVAAFGAMIVMPAHAQHIAQQDDELAAGILSDGQTLRAIAMLEAELENDPQDPALLINLGIAQAQAGSEDEARASFEAAMNSREVFDLDTANGRTTDSRKLARLAIAMLDRGEFRPVSVQSDQLTLRE